MNKANKILMSIFLIVVLPFMFGFIYGSSFVDLECFQDAIAMLMLGITVLFVNIITSPLTWVMLLIVLTVKFVTNDKY